MRNFLLLMLMAVMQSVCMAQQTGYNLQFKIEGLRDTTAMLGYYYGESIYVKDTATVDDKGKFSFSGKDLLSHGVYFLALNKTQVFEFVISDDQHFKMESATGDYIKNMKVTGDSDNRIFFENILFETQRHKEAMPFMAVIRDSTSGEAQKKEALESFNKIRQKVIDYQARIIAEYPRTMSSRIYKISQPVKIPDPVVALDGSAASSFQLKWYREHFFDNFDISDDALLRLSRPLYREKITEYLDKLFVPESDTIIKAIEWMVARAKNNAETYKYLIRECLMKYQDPDIMGLEKVFVHLNDKYFASGEMNSWANEKLRKNLKEQADRLRRSMIGMKGANLVMQDANLKLRSMYDIPNAYTVIYFFDPDCGYCKKETPKLADFYNKNKSVFNVEVYAVCEDTSLVKMRKYIKEMDLNWITVNGPRSAVGNYHNLYDALTTPMLYVLDEKKKIIAKKIPAEKLEEFLINYERFKKKRAG